MGTMLKGLLMLAGVIPFSENERILPIAAGAGRPLKLDHREHA